MRCRLRIPAAIAVAVLPLSPVRADDSTTPPPAQAPAMQSATTQLAPQDDTAANIYKSTLPSIMTLHATRDDGEVTGTGFLAIKDGIAVTAWHVVNGAKSVTAKFANGEVDEVTGVVDKDEKADVAIVRVKEYGIPLLNLKAVDPDIGTRAFAIGAPLGLDFSISDGIVSQIRDLNGVKNLQFTCPISHGNSGGPLMTADGSVIGVVDSTRIDGQNLNFAIPIRKVLALDSTLATQPWGSVKMVSSPAGTAEDDLIATALTAYVDGLSAFRIASVHLINKDSRAAIDKTYYQGEIEVNDALNKLQQLSDPSPEVSSLASELASRMNKESEMLDLFTKTIQWDLAPDSGWNNRQTRQTYMATVALYESLLEPFGPGLSKWESTLYFQTKFTQAQAQTIAAVLSTTDYVIGGAAFVETPNCVVGIDNRRTVCGRLGLRDGDILQKVNDKDVGNLSDLNAVVKANRGQRIKVLVLRDGNAHEFSPKVPDDLPTGPFDYERH